MVERNCRSPGSYLGWSKHRDVSSRACLLQATTSLKKYMGLVNPLLLSFHDPPRGLLRLTLEHNTCVIIFSLHIQLITSGGGKVLF